MWFFKGYCEMLQPKYCCLIDTGTIPQPKSLTKFYVMMEGDDNIGGVCGCIL